MKPTLLSLLLCGALSATAQAQITLNGNLLTDVEQPVPDTKVVVAGGDFDITDSKGVFSIKVPRHLVEGERVILIVQKKDWVINYPLDGEWNLPNIKLQNVQYTKVIIVPKGSKALWSHARIEKFIRDLAGKTAQQAPATDEAKKIDFGRYIKEWAAQYGFSAEQAKEEIDKWIADIEAKSNDLTKLGLAAFAKRNFPEAAKNFEAAFAQDSTQLATIKKQQQALEEKEKQLTAQAVENARLAGDSYYNDNRFDKALAAYQRAQQLVDKTKAPQQWAGLQNAIGRSHIVLGLSNLHDNQYGIHFDVGLSAFSAALEVTDNIDTLRYESVKTRRLLGALTRVFAISPSLSETIQERMLDFSFICYHDALEMIDRKTQPELWAETQVILGDVLYSQGERTNDPEIFSLATACYIAALEVYNRDIQPKDWAEAQNKLGNALEMQGRLTNNSDLLKQAVAAHRAVLQIYTRETQPMEWAQTKTNLGWCLTSQSVIVSGVEKKLLLEEALTSYRDAFKVYSRVAQPHEWIKAQQYLGFALELKAKVVDDVDKTEVLSQAIIAYREVLEIVNPDSMFQQWISIQNSLGIVWSEKGEFGQAALCFENVLFKSPDNQRAYIELSLILHDNIHEYDRAFTLNQDWVDRHPDDLSAQCDFAEKHFTTGRFAECEKRLAALYLNLKIEPQVKSALRAIGIANAIALGQTKEVPNQLETLQTSIASQPDTFQVGWSFEGTKHFISQNETPDGRGLAPYREWLLQLFQALEIKEGREAILAALREVREKFSVMGKKD